MLPARQEAEELRRGDGLDLPAESVERVVVNAREKAPVAPRPLPGDARAQHGALSFELEEARIVADDRSERLHPSAKDRFRIARRLAGEPAIPVPDDAPSAGELVQPRLPGPTLVHRHVAHPEERLVDLLGIRRLGPGLFSDARDRVGIEGAELVGRAGVEDAAGVDGLRAPLLERSVVQERVRLRGEDAARERGRFHRVDRPPLDRAVFQAAQHFHETVHVHRLGQTVLDRLGDDGMVHRDRDGAARQGLRAREHLREGGGEKIVRPHPQEVRRDLLAVAGPLPGWR